jgi:hypothetical protein
MFPKFYALGNRKLSAKDKAIVISCMAFLAGNCLELWRRHTGDNRVGMWLRQQQSDEYSATKSHFQ